jgi:hypothetical protein
MLALLELKLTIQPPEGAGLCRVTVPCEAIVAITGFGLIVTPVTLSPVTANVAFAAELASAAKMPQVVLTVEGFVVMVKLALLLPAVTLTVGGTPSDVGVCVDRFTVQTFEGNTWLYSVTVPVELTPPSTVLGLKLRPVM